MKARPILFSTPMIRALLNGRKTQTRRAVKPQPVYGDVDGLFASWQFSAKRGTRILYPNAADAVLQLCPYGQPGDLLYVKEATWIWCKRVRNGTTKTGRQKWRYEPVGQHVVYCADSTKPTIKIDNDPDHLWRYKTARFMPRWASRLTLRLANVRVERVQEISESDAIAEGLERRGGPGCDHQVPTYHIGNDYHNLCPPIVYQRLWDSINTSRGYSFASNPWVWCLSFSAIKKNVDEVLRKAA